MVSEYWWSAHLCLTLISSNSLLLVLFLSSPVSGLWVHDFFFLRKALKLLSPFCAHAHSSMSPFCMIVWLPKPGTIPSGPEVLQSLITSLEYSLSHVQCPKINNIHICRALCMPITPSPSFSFSSSAAGEGRDLL